MSKKTKIIISLISTPFLFFGIFFLFSKDIQKDNLSPVAIKQEKEYANLPDIQPQTVKTILEINDKKYETEIREETSVYDFMNKLRSEGKINFKEKNYVGMGKFILEINGIKNSGDKNWIFYVNREKANVGVSNYKIMPGDVVSWNYEKNN